jgi:hypothetical protein
MSSITSDIEALRNAVRGHVLTAEDPSYDDARRVWNAMIDKRPAVIVRCAGTADVIEAVKFGREASLSIAVRGGGHNVAGFSTCDDGLVIDLSPMKGIRVDPVTHTARAEPGVLWKELDHETQAFGLATTGGLVGHTGIAGLTLGGGIGWLMRKCGLSCDNLLSADIVTADGRLLKADATENDDLYWALRGGGGNFGIVTSFEYRLHRVGPMVVGGLALYPAAMAGDLVRFYREWTPTLPEELTTLFVFITAPPEPFVPESMHGKPAVAILACYAGSIDDGIKAVQGLKDYAPPAADLLAPMPYLVLQQLFDVSVPWGLQNYEKSEYLSSLPDGLISALQEGAMKLPSPLAGIHIHHLGGAVAREDGGPTAVGRRDAPYILNLRQHLARPLAERISDPLG